jgi:hypothetical protein
MPKAVKKVGRPRNADRKHPGGRPTKMTPETIKKLEDVFMVNGSVVNACFMAGITTNTFYNYLKENPEYSDRIKALREMVALSAKRTLAQGVKEDANLALKTLKNVLPNDYNEKTTQDVNMAGQVNVISTYNDILTKLKDKKKSGSKS